MFPGEVPVESVGEGGYGENQAGEYITKRKPQNVAELTPEREENHDKGSKEDPGEAQDVGKIPDVQGSRTSRAVFEGSRPWWDPLILPSQVGFADL